MPEVAVDDLKLTFDAIFYQVSDLEKAIAFYRDILGFHPTSRDYVARFSVGGVLFELVPAAPGKALAGNARLCLAVKDLPTATRILQAKGVQTTPIKKEPGGQLCYFTDPDGNELCLWQATTAPKGKELRTVYDPAGVPILEIVKSEDGNVTVFEADDMDNKVQFPMTVVSTLVQRLETL